MDNSEITLCRKNKVKSFPACHEILTIRAKRPFELDIFYSRMLLSNAFDSEPKRNSALLISPDMQSVSNQEKLSQLELEYTLDLHLVNNKRKSFLRVNN